MKTMNTCVEHKCPYYVWDYNECSKTEGECWLIEGEVKVIVLKEDKDVEKLYDALEDALGE